MQTSIFCSTGNTFTVPDFISHVPPGHYTGVSGPCVDLQSARNSAISDVVRQILGSINAEYNQFYSIKISGSPQKPEMLIKDEFSRIASGVVLDVEKNIVRSSYCLDVSGRYICFVLIKYSELQIKKMRHLSRGGNVVASALPQSGSILRVKVSETNGVAVTLVSADISVLKKNHFAKMINFCIWKVPYNSKESFSLALNPIKICGGASIIKIDVHRFQKDWNDYLLGTRLEFDIKLKGFDEIGRTVFTSINI
jgi:hypothetical protein